MRVQSAIATFRLPAILAIAAATILLLPSAPMYAQGTAAADADTLNAPLEWPGFESALDAAGESEKIVLIDIFSPHCGWCRKMQAEIYTQPHVQEYVMEHFELGRLDITVYEDSVSYRGYEMSQAAMAASFGSRGTPTTIFLEPNGDYITRLPGFHETAEFMAVLRYIGSRSYEQQSFQEYLSATAGE